jgi:hypothetical protein
MSNNSSLRGFTRLWSSTCSFTLVHMCISHTTILKWPYNIFDSLLKAQIASAITLYLSKIVPITIRGSTRNSVHHRRPVLLHKCLSLATQTKMTIRNEGTQLHTSQSYNSLSLPLSAPISNRNLNISESSP